MAAQMPETGYSWTYPVAPVSRGADHGPRYRDQGG
jgi:hypothetical protein